MKTVMTGLCLAAMLAGCKARHKVAESASASGAESVAAARRMAERQALVTALHETLVLESPEIIVHDPVTERSVTIRGERIVSGREATAESEKSTITEADSAASVTVDAASQRKASTEGKTGLNLPSVVFIGIVILIIGRQLIKNI
ncbi:MAG: hypothetical protein K2J66_01945 [Muribaculaceae bacterium]|nr:hypothetical protein [Muribaculaceae bacterium]